MKTAIIMAAPQEFVIKDKQVKQTEVNGLPIFFSSVGKANASFCLGKLIAQGYDNIINIGTVAGFGLNQGDVVVPKTFIEWDFDLSAMGIPKGQVWNAKSKYIESKSMFNFNAFKTADCKHLATADCFVDDWQKVFEVDKDVNLIDMESAPMARICLENNVNFAAIKVVSDNANGDSKLAWYEFVDGQGKDIIKTIVNKLAIDFAGA